MPMALTSNVDGVVTLFFTTFEQGELGEVPLVPGTCGVFEVCVEGKTLWSREQKGRFPEAKELKQLVRDVIAPEKELGHSERLRRELFQQQANHEAQEGLEVNHKGGLVVRP